jgi:hypothetical protein
MNAKFLGLMLMLMASFSNAQLLKISNEGEPLPNFSTLQRCILDNQSKLLWEVKSSEQGLQNTLNTYTWFDGKTGQENADYSHHCHWGEFCNTQAYVAAINEMSLCARTNWRLPTHGELQTLLLYGDEDLLINPDFFPNTQLKSYWTGEQLNANIAIDVPFFYGGSKGSDKSFDAYIRLVSDADY